MNKNHQKRKKQYSSHSSLSDSVLSNKIDHESKRHKMKKKKNYHKRDPIKLCKKLTAKLLTTLNKLKIVKFKLDEDPLQRQIYFLIIIESLEIIFSQYKKTCEVFLVFPKIGGEYIKYYVKNAMSNLLHANIDIHSRKLIDEFSGDGVKFIPKLQSHCANKTFSEKVDMMGISSWNSRTL